VAGLRVIAFDQPGFGVTDNPRDFTVAYCTKFIMKLRDALDLPSAARIGHSQAGNMAVANAFAYRIAKIMILGTGSLLPPLPEGQSKAAGPAEGQEETAKEPTCDCLL
jgi:pimeloyl-ACP methyl ester carboxylesterase